MFTHRTKRLGLIVFTAGLALGASRANAEEKAPSKDPEKLKSGVIASFGSAKNVAAVDVPVVDQSPGEQPTPVTASVSRKGQSRCVATVTNASTESAYSVNFDVIGNDTSGRITSRRNFTATVGAGKSETREVTCGRDDSMQVVLKSGRKVK